jgi:hypothetical protein
MKFLKAKTFVYVQSVNVTDLLSFITSNLHYDLKTESYCGNWISALLSPVQTVFYPSMLDTEPVGIVLSVKPTT